jgi:hypothetical protein
VAHVELSLSGAFVPQTRAPANAELANVSRWTATVAAADEPCLVIDTTRSILAISASCGELLGLGDAVGQSLLGVLCLLDFTAGRAELAEPETEKIPPLLALITERLARGLMRVQRGDDRASDVTVDALSTPLWERGTVAASLTFFSAVV